MIYSTIFLHFKEEWITTTSTRLQETEPTYNKEQDAIILNWESNWQTQRDKILQ